MAKRLDVIEKPEAEEIARPIEYELTEPILSYGDEIKIIRMRKPTGGDLIRVGNPVTFYPHVDPPKIEHDMARMMSMVARLSDIPTSSLERLTTQDMTGLAWTLSPFFIPAP